MELFNHLKKHYGLRNDTDLAEFLGTSTTMICEVRSKKRRVTGDFILKVYDKTSLSISMIRTMMEIQNGR